MGFGFFAILASRGRGRFWPDRRTENWPLVKSPVPMLLIISAYLIVVRYGPRMMASRQPFQLKPLLVIYNFSVAALNLYIAGEVRISISSTDSFVLSGPFVDHPGPSFAATTLVSFVTLIYFFLLVSYPFAHELSFLRKRCSLLYNYLTENVWPSKNKRCKHFNAEFLHAKQITLLIPLFNTLQTPVFEHFHAQELPLLFKTFT